MVSIPNGANFSVPGAGKTMTTLATWQFLRTKEKIDKLLIISPKSAFEAWAEEEPKETFIEDIKTQIFIGGAIKPNTEILITPRRRNTFIFYCSDVSCWISPVISVILSAVPPDLSACSLMRSSESAS